MFWKGIKKSVAEPKVDIGVTKVMAERVRNREDVGRMFRMRLQSTDEDSATKEWGFCKGIAVSQIVQSANIDSCPPGTMGCQDSVAHFR